MKTNLYLYTDYLLSSFGLATATGLSDMLDKAVSHNDVTRFLSSLELGRQALWQQVKPLVRQLEKALPEEEQGLLVLDDLTVEKAHCKGNGLISVHYEHSKDRFVKGINLVSALLLGRVSVPMAYEPVMKTLRCGDQEGMLEERVDQERDVSGYGERYLQNSLRFRYVLCDSWYTNSGTSSMCWG